MENLNLDLFSPKKAELQELATKYAGLKIEWIDDKKWFEAVHKAQMELRNARISIEKTRLEYTRQFDEAKKQAISLEKELLAIIVPIEEELKAQKEAIEAEKERIRQEELEQKRLFLQNRVDKLSSFEYIFSDLLKLAQMSEEEFDSLLVEAKTSFEQKQAQKEEEEKKRQEEIVLAQKNEIRSKILNAQSLETISEIEDYIENIWFSLEEFQDIAWKKALLEQQASILEQQRKIDEENARIQKEKEEAARKKELEEAQEKARKEWEEKAKREAEEKRILEEKKAQEELQRKAQEEKAAQERLEKETKYKEFLAKNEWKYDKIVKEEWKVVLYKAIDEFIL